MRIFYHAKVITFFFLISCKSINASSQGFLNTYRSIGFLKINNHKKYDTLGKPDSVRVVNLDKKEIVENVVVKFDTLQQKSNNQVKNFYKRVPHARQKIETKLYSKYDSIFQLKRQKPSLKRINQKYDSIEFAIHRKTNLAKIDSNVNYVDSLNLSNKHFKVMNAYQLYGNSEDLTLTNVIKEDTVTTTGMATIFKGTTTNEGIYENRKQHNISNPFKIKGAEQLVSTTITPKDNIKHVVNIKKSQRDSLNSLIEKRFSSNDILSTGQMNEVTREGMRYKKDVNKLKNYKKLDIKSKDSLKSTYQSTLESNANKSDIGKIISNQNKEVQNQSNLFQQYDKMLNNVAKGKISNDQLTMLEKEAGVSILSKQAMVNNGIKQLEKLKKTHKIIIDSRYLSKIPNALKNQSFKDRLLFGLSLQMYQAVGVYMDASPYMLYKLSGRFRVGFGLGERISINQIFPFFNAEHIHTIRLLLDTKLANSLYIHVENEWLYNSGATYSKMPQDPLEKKWLSRLNFGLLKTYPITKGIDGQVQILYNIFNISNFPNMQQTSIRFGIEYKLQKK